MEENKEKQAKEDEKKQKEKKKEKERRRKMKRRRRKRRRRGRSGHKRRRRQKRKRAEKKNIRRILDLCELLEHARLRDPVVPARPVVELVVNAAQRRRSGQRVEILDGLQLTGAAYARPRAADTPSQSRRYRRRTTEYTAMTSSIT